MIIYKLKNGEVKEVEAEKLEYPLKDSEGDTIYLNTHYKTRKEALERQYRETMASIKQINDGIKQAQAKERELKDELAEWTDILIKNQKELQMFP